MCEICSKLTIKTPERRQWCPSGVFIINFEQILYIPMVFPLLTFNKWMSTAQANFLQKITASSNRFPASFKMAPGYRVAKFELKVAVSESTNNELRSK